MEFTSTGAPSRNADTRGTGNSQFSAPKGNAVDSTGDVYVTEWGNNRVQTFAKPGAATAPTSSSVKPVLGASGVPSDLNGDQKGFPLAIDARTHMRIKDTQPLKDGDIIRIVSAAK